MSDHVCEPDARLDPMDTRRDRRRHMTTFDTFVHPCLDCGTTIHVVNGQAEAHDCAALPERDRVAYAWWQGYDTAKPAPLRETAAEALGARLLATQAQQDDLRVILDALGLSTHARPHSPHEVVQREVLPAIAWLGREIHRYHDRAMAAEALEDALRDRANNAEAEVARLLAECADRESERADLRDRVQKAEAQVARVEALRAALPESGWVGPWVHALNMRDELDAILSNQPSPHGIRHE